jgi:hypothetical protein
LGGLFHFSREYWGPRRIRKIAKHEKLNALIFHGFKFNDEIPGYEAALRGFRAAVSAHSDEEGEFVWVGCLVSVPESRFDATFEFAEKGKYDRIGAGNQSAWLCDRVAISILGKIPEAGEIIARLNNLTDELKNNQFAPAKPLV